MDIDKTVLIGYASGLGAENHACGTGPRTVIEAPAFKPLQSHIAEQYFFEPNIEVYKEQAIEEIARLSTQVADVTSQKYFPITLGGDHTSAIGTYSGLAHQHTGNIGLIWLDAHLDSHTPKTTHSSNTHGMPLAVLLGHGDARLTSIAHKGAKLNPKHVCVIGARDYEDEEHALLNKLGVKIFYMDDVNTRGLENVFLEALQIVNNGTDGFGISFDLDVIDPNDAPGTGVQVPNGILAAELLEQLRTIPKERLLGIDITEFNPTLDIDDKTLNIVIDTLRIFMHT